MKLQLVQPRYVLPIAAWLSTLAPSRLEACFWDKDTLAHEQRLAPGVLKVIAGDFPRRSPLLYQLRAQWRTKQLREAGYAWLLEPAQEGDVERSLSPQALRWTDDLAVALDRLERRDEGLKLLKSLLPHYPKRYETLANLGTLLIHSGAYEEGLAQLERALELNPQAHFGRERIQVALVRYIIRDQSRSGPLYPLSKRCLTNPKLPVMSDPWLKGLPEARWEGQLARPKRGSAPVYIEPGGGDWMCMVMPSAQPKEGCRGFCAALKRLEISPKEGLKGVLGMMRFSDHRHPALLEALGDLLLAKGYKGPNRLAAMAYLQASRATGLDQQARRGYEALAALSLVGHRFGLKELDETLQKQLKRAARLSAKIARDEERWSRRGERYLERSYQRRYLR